MNAENIWSKLISLLMKAPAEVETVPSNSRQPLWFNAYVENGDLYVQNSVNHKPSTNMIQRRKITKKDFETVYAYYQRWAMGERYLRQEVRTLSRNTAYIFGLTARFQ